jgi:predicted restriction endonuclease
MSDTTKPFEELAHHLRHKLTDVSSDMAVNLVRIRSELRTIETLISGVCVARHQFSKMAEFIGEIEDLIAMTHDEDVHLATAIYKIKGSVDAAVSELVSNAKASVSHPINDPEVRAKVWAITGGKCAYCGCDLTQGDHESRGTSFSVEHVVPRQHGGPDNIANHVPACASCNSSKSTDHVLTFINRNIERRISNRAPLRVVNSDVEGDL